jgi:hypothetical protein
MASEHCKKKAWDRAMQAGSGRRTQVKIANKLACDRQKSRFLP